MNYKNIALLGGTFDPIHNGHLEIVKQVITKLNPAEIKFIPNKTPPHRQQPIASAIQRVAMLDLAIKSADLSSFTNITNITIEPCEIQRSGKSYMVDTIKYFKAQPNYNNTNFWLILGLDAFSSLPQWHCWQELLTICNFIVINRELDDFYPTSWSINYLQQHFLEINNHSLANIKTQLNGRVIKLDIPLINISGTNMRELFKNYKKNHALIKSQIPLTVIDYILVNKLYSC